MEPAERFSNYSAANIAELRRQSGLSRQAVVDQLAEYGVHLPPTSLRRIEQGVQSVKIEEAQAFAHMFDIDLADFITKPVNPKVAKIGQSIQGHRAQLKALSAQLFEVVTAWNDMVEEADYDSLSQGEIAQRVMQEAIAEIGRASALLPRLFDLEKALGELGVESQWREVPERAQEALESPLVRATASTLGTGESGEEANE